MKRAKKGEQTIIHTGGQPAGKGYWESILINKTINIALNFSSPLHPPAVVDGLNYLTHPLLLLTTRKSFKLIINICIFFPNVLITLKTLKSEIISNQWYFKGTYPSTMLIGNVLVRVQRLTN